METLWTLLIIPATLALVKMFLSHHFKKKDRAEEIERREKEDAEKQKWNTISELIGTISTTQQTLIKKIDDLEDNKATWDKYDRLKEQNRLDHKELWEHFRTELEQQGREISEIRGILRSTNK